MKTFIRWGKFNLVGAMGMAVQLAALALFNRWMGGRYLYASAAAIELTLLHNFVWHVRYTWRDRRYETAWWRQLMRFQLANGVVSMLGNLALMRVLVQEARLPLLVANAVAIVCCSMANFWLGNRWTFAGGCREGSPYADFHCEGRSGVVYFATSYAGMGAAARAVGTGRGRGRNDGGTHSRV